jgi:hypothetical protein
MIWRHCNLLSKYGNLTKCGKNRPIFSPKRAILLDTTPFFIGGQVAKIGFHGVAKK